jgi:hypothetical protein
MNTVLLTGRLYPPFYPLAKFFESKSGINGNIALAQFTYENAGEITSDKMSANALASMPLRRSTN